MIIFIHFARFQVDAGFATLDTTHALCLPLGASISLLVMFFFFDSMQMLFAVCTASEYIEKFILIRLKNLFSYFSVIATVALAFLLLPMCQYIIRPCTDGNRISFLCGRFTAAELFSFTLSITVVCIWVLTGHWLLMDAMVRMSNVSNVSVIINLNYLGNRIVCGIYCLCPASQLESIDPTANWSPDL